MLRTTTGFTPDFVCLVRGNPPSLLERDPWSPWSLCPSSLEGSGLPLKAPGASG